MTQSAPRASISLQISKTINAPRERVFNAWTQPELLHQWWRAKEDFSAPIAEVDLKVGGKYRLGMLEPGKEAPYVCHGVYREVNPPEKLVFTWAGEVAWTTWPSCWKGVSPGIRRPLGPKAAKQPLARTGRCGSRPR